jgi:hypothetical protein
MDLLSALLWELDLFEGWRLREESFLLKFCSLLSVSAEVRMNSRIWIIKTLHWDATYEDTPLFSGLVKAVIHLYRCLNSF